MPVDRGAFFQAWADARWSAVQLRTASDVSARQARMWRRLDPVIRRTPALSHLAGRPLHEFPITRPDALRGRFEAWNTLGLSLNEAEAAAEQSEQGGAGEVRPGVVAGYSTGSSGRRGLFLSTSRERGLYLGHALARLLPASTILRGLRIGLCLRANNQLYGDVAGTGRIRFRFFGLDLPPDERRQALDSFRPHVLIAPSHVLAGLARDADASPDLRPARLFYGAEPMGDAERDWIHSRLGARPDPIYQATEGFLGSACAFGALHLNEDVVAVELMPTRVARCFQPVVTDLRRTSQPIVRVLLDDLIEPVESPCPCGSPLQALRGLAGRVGDLWSWGPVVVTPRAVTEVMEAATPPGTRWTATASSGEVRLECEPGYADQARAALKRLLLERGVTVEIVVERPSTPEQPKRRRVRWRDA